MLSVLIQDCQFGRFKAYLRKCSSYPRGFDSPVHVQLHHTSLTRFLGMRIHYMCN